MKPTGHRGRNSLKLLRRIDGPAVLTAGERTIEVECSAGEYEDRTRVTVTGALEGDLSRFEHNTEAQLRLGDGAVLQIRLIEPDDAGADFRTA